MKLENQVQRQTGVYIMTGTLDGETLIKVGKTTAGVERRLTQLRADCYAGISDWKLHTWFALDNARLTSALEKILHDELEHFNVPLPNGAGGMATEVFDITPKEAGGFLTSALSEIDGYVTLDAQLVGGVDYRSTTSRGSHWTSSIRAPASHKLSRQVRKRSVRHQLTLMLMTVLVFLGMVFAANAKANMDTCLTLSSVAKTIMTARQDGMPMDKMIGNARESDFNETELAAIVSIIVDAYDYPKMSVRANQVEAANEFGAEHLVNCLRAKS